MEFAAGLHAQEVQRISAGDAIRAVLICPDGEQDGRLTFGAPIPGRTRLMKELFLVSRETEVGQAGAFGFEFTPGPYGPSSVEVQHELDRLTTIGDVLQDPLERGDGTLVRISERGYEWARSIWSALPPETARGFYSIKSRFNQVPYAALMFYVYSAYAEFTANSRIREEVLGPHA
ncbi:MAG: hypothetical protein L3J68_00250 [Thermoplasmata archaeon]|nr:hypothetical protein [Thermoplasmata archaeon]